MTSLLAAVFRVLKSGILVSDAHLPTAMTDDERVLTNLLLAKKDDGTGRPLSLAEIGLVLNCSDESIRRRLRKLDARFPQLATVIRAFRSRNQKGDSLPPGRPDHQKPEAPE